MYGNLEFLDSNENEYEFWRFHLSFKNGSLTRQRIRDSAAGGSWQLFNELLDSTPRGNFGNVGLYFDAQEILPPLSGDHRFNKANDEISRYSSKEVEVRALIEGQFVAKRAHAEDFGFTIGSSLSKHLIFIFFFVIISCDESVSVQVQKRESLRQGEHPLTKLSYKFLPMCSHRQFILR